jgi:hypothetical protein
MCIGGHLDREHGGGPETRQGWWGGEDRSDRASGRDRERYDERYKREEPSFINRMTGTSLSNLPFHSNLCHLFVFLSDWLRLRPGGRFDREHGGGPEARRVSLLAPLFDMSSWNQ